MRLLPSPTPVEPLSSDMGDGSVPTWLHSTGLSLPGFALPFSLHSGSLGTEISKRKNPQLTALNIPGPTQHTPDVSSSRKPKHLG